MIYEAFLRFWNSPEGDVVEVNDVVLRPPPKIEIREHNNLINVDGLGQAYVDGEVKSQLFPLVDLGIGNFDFRLCVTIC